VCVCVCVCGKSHNTTRLNQLTLLVVCCCCETASKNPLHNAATQGHTAIVLLLKHGTGLSYEIINAQDSVNVRFERFERETMLLLL
jgi:hypothetical protein